MTNLLSCSNQVIVLSPLDGSDVGAGKENFTCCRKKANEVRPPRLRMALSATCRNVADGSCAAGAAGAAFQVVGRSDSQGSRSTVTDP